MKMKINFEIPQNFFLFKSACFQDAVPSCYKSHHPSAKETLSHLLK